MSVCCDVTRLKFEQTECKHNRRHVQDGAEKSVSGQCPVNHRSTTLKSWEFPKNKRKILRRRPRRRGELVQADKSIGAVCGGEASIRAGETAIKTLFTGGWSVLEVHQSCSLREIVGILPNGFGDRRSGMVIPGSEQVATDSKAACHVRPTRADHFIPQRIKEIFKNPCTKNRTLQVIYECSSP